MKTNTVKEKLARGDYAYGTMVFEFNSTGIGRIVGEAGAEFVIYDMEHTGWSIETIRMLIATTGASKALPMVRVPATQYHLISRPLDVGAMGIMVPMVEDEAQARTIVRSAKYPPDGARGAAFGVAHDDYIAAPVTEVMTSSNKEGFIMAQIETVSGIENCEAIAAVEGIDCLWVGHFDLSLSMGIPAQFDNPAFLKAIEKVANACEKHGKAPGVMINDAESARVWKDFGYRALAYLGDVWLYQNALKQGLMELRGLE
jgi:2-dehydro-3-deoxyglucarate aldolase/4-hydroxy-2-oxoheptanedioate aldolase